MKLQLPRNTTFLARHDKLFRNLALLLKLEILIENNEKKFKALGIADLPSLLLAMSVAPVQIPMVLSGVAGFKVYQRERLVDLCDPFAKKREQLSQQIKFAKKDKRDAEVAPLSTLIEFERQRSKVNALDAKINDLEMEKLGLGERNTVPADLYRHHQAEELAELGFIEIQKGWPYPKFTQKGWELFATAQTVFDLLNSQLNHNATANPEMNNSTWQRMKGMYVNG